MGKLKADNCVFLLKRCRWELFCQQTQKTFICEYVCEYVCICIIYSYFLSQLNRPSFSQESAVCIKQDLWSYAAICYHTSITSLSWCRSLCGSGSFLSSLKWKVNGHSSWAMVCQTPELNSHFLNLVITRFKRCMPARIWV